ncbi:ATP-binding cassette domain-containing protein [Paracoccus sp. MBLB3053]|uniref:ATP-binding cassette domain-containing protein n=1 Tax=Paracoccus aurantius TaxID=3073814 RepID=A0ABU2HYE7_9RHOB|nr:ATP-binding cassette domain-containing protein [Paracoccus sp. MBLB3053]MDS9470065.1 ATP-binding cassette domain-containing protein [Paracoccus sp. MBLB3053]
MIALLRLARALLANAPWAMARGAALSVLVLLMGAGLLGLSGWFITATGLAGLAGIGIAFDVFRPSAGVRFLALGRAAARYGERVLTHDATLRALAALRVTILQRHARTDARALTGLRGETVLTRILSDVDALDGLVIRLILPALAGLLAHLVVFALLCWLVGTIVALSILAGYLPAAVAILWVLARRGLAPADEAEVAGQALRRGVIDMIRDREALILAGQLGAQEERLLALDRRARDAAAALDRAERLAGLMLSGLVALVSGLALLAGGWLLSQEGAGPALAIIGFFVALALGETILPLRRGFAELGRMVGAARRIAPENHGVGPAEPQTNREFMPSVPLLSVARPELDFVLSPGEALALTGPSGAGKTTLLMQIAGLIEPNGILISGRSPDDWPDGQLREIVAALPQRSALLAGTIRDNLALAGDLDDTELWAALKAVDLDADIRARGGLGARLGEAGAGLSGGQARRLALARCLLRKPAILLLDEPTEGLDAMTADRVLNGVRKALPSAAILAALHRGHDHPIFDRRDILSL